MKEREAESKWCPFIEVALTTLNTALNNPSLLSAAPVNTQQPLITTNRGPNSNSFFCISKHCMAWEQIQKPLTEFGDEPATDEGYCKRLG